MMQFKYKLTRYTLSLTAKKFQDQKKGSGRLPEVVKTEVLQETIDFIQQESFKTTFTLDDVNEKMKELAGEREFYVKKTLRSKLKQEFGDSLEYINIGSRADILCFKSNADQIIADYHSAAKNDDGIDPKKKLLLAAAQILRDEAKCVRELQSTDYYPSMNNLDRPDPSVPPAYRWFFEALLSAELTEIWAQCLLRKVLPREPVSPFQLANALYLKNNWNSKKLNNHIARIGFSVPYHESQNYLWAWLKNNVESSIEPGEEEDEQDSEDNQTSITQYVVDNLDLTMNSANRIISVHGTASIKVESHTQETPDDSRVERQVITTSDKKEVLEKSRSSLQPYHFSKKTRL